MSTQTLSHCPQIGVMSHVLGSWEVLKSCMVVKFLIKVLLTLTAV